MTRQNRLLYHSIESHNCNNEHLNSIDRPKLHSVRLNSIDLSNKSILLHCTNFEKSVHERKEEDETILTHQIDYCTIRLSRTTASTSILILLTDQNFIWCD